MVVYCDDRPPITQIRRVKSSMGLKVVITLGRPLLIFINKLTRLTDPAISFFYVES